MFPAVPACAVNAAALSTSVALSVPPVVCTALVSVRLALAVPVITAASLVPVSVTVTTCVVPSAVATVKLSVTTWPAARLSSAVPVV